MIRLAVCIYLPLVILGCLKKKPDIALYIKYNRDNQPDYHDIINRNKYGNLKIASENFLGFHNYKDGTFKLGLKKFESIPKEKVSQIPVEQCQKIREITKFNLSCKSIFIWRIYESPITIKLTLFYLSKIVEIPEDHNNSQVLATGGLLLQYENKISIYLPTPKVVDIETGGSSLSYVDLIKEKENYYIVAKETFYEREDLLLLEADFKTGIIKKIEKKSLGGL